MRAVHISIRQIGNSHGVVIPKPVLAQLGLDAKAGVVKLRTAVMTSLTPYDHAFVEELARLPDSHKRVAAAAADPAEAQKLFAEIHERVRARPEVRTAAETTSPDLVALRDRFRHLRTEAGLSPSDRAERRFSAGGSRAASAGESEDPAREAVALAGSTPRSPMPGAGRSPGPSPDRVRRRGPGVAVPTCRRVIWGTRNARRSDSGHARVQSQHGRGRPAAGQVSPPRAERRPGERDLSASIRTKKIRVNGARAEEAQLLKAGDVVTVRDQALKASPAPGAAPPLRKARAEFRDPPRGQRTSSCAQACRDSRCTRAPASLKRRWSTRCARISAIPREGSSIQPRRIGSTARRAASSWSRRRGRRSSGWRDLHRGLGEEDVPRAREGTPRRGGVIDVPLAEHQQSGANKASAA